MRKLGIAITVLVVFWSTGVSHADTKKIKILDKCDPATFNTPARVLCDPDFDGGVTLEEFNELLSPSAFGHPAWRFNAPYVEIESDEKVRVTNRPTVSPLTNPLVYCHINSFQGASTVEKAWPGGENRREGRASYHEEW